MATAFLSKKFKEEQIRSFIETAAQSAMHIAESKMQNKFYRDKLVIPNERQDINKYITTSINAIPKTDIDTNLRVHRIKEASRARKVLEDRLEALNSSINQLQEQDKPAESPPVRVKPNFINKEARLNEIQEEKKKEEEAKQFVVRIKKQQEDFEQRMEAQKREEQQKMLQEAAETARQRKEQEEESRQAKKRAAEESLERQKSRKEKITQEFAKNDERYRRTLEQKPLFARYQESFAEKTVLPEIERRNKIMAEAHDRFGSVPHQEIQKHNTEYLRVLKQQQERREKEVKSAKLEIRMNSMLVNHSVVTNRSVDLVKINRELEEKSKEEKNQRIMKQDRYAKMIKEMFVPKVDKAKQLELELRKMKKSQRNQPLKRSYQSSDTRSYINLGSESRATLEESRSFRRRKFKPNPMVPKCKSVEPPKVIDFLAERRVARAEGDPSLYRRPISTNWITKINKQDLAPKEKLQKVRENSLLVEKEIRRKEFLLRDTSTNAAVALDVEDHVNDLLISNIKAKLALIENH